MKEHEDTYVAVVEKYTLDGANTFTLMKYKRDELRMNDAIMLLQEAKNVSRTQKKLTSKRCAPFSINPDCTLKPLVVSKHPNIAPKTIAPLVEF